MKKAITILYTGQSQRKLNADGVLPGILWGAIVGFTMVMWLLMGK